MMMMVLLGLFLLAALYVDLTRMLIPNQLTLPAMALGIAMNTIRSGWSGFGFAVSGLLVGAGATWLLYVLRAVGAGDVKLFGAIGAWAGMMFALGCLLDSVLIAGAIAGGWLLVRNRLPSYLHAFGYAALSMICMKDVQPILAAVNGERTKIPFMVAVLPAAIMMWTGS